MQDGRRWLGLFYSTADCPVSLHDTLDKAIAAWQKRKMLPGYGEFDHAVVVEFRDRKLVKVHQVPAECAK